MVNSCRCHQRNSLSRDPPPVSDGLGHSMRLHLGFQIKVEYLKRICSFQSQNFRNRIHDGGVGSNFVPSIALIGKIYDNNAIRIVRRITHTDELVTFHRD